jgi:hypothetical protein
MSDVATIEREDKLRAWFTRDCDLIQKMLDGLDIGWGGVQHWATARMTLPADSLHLDFACGYATFLAQLGWRFPTAHLLELNERNHHEEQIPHPSNSYSILAKYRFWDRKHRTRRRDYHRQHN